MEEMIKMLTNFGGMGVVAGILFWQMSKLQSRLLDIIEKNTRAFEELKAVIDKCQIYHKTDGK